MTLKYSWEVHSWIVGICHLNFRTSIKTVGLGEGERERGRLVLSESLKADKVLLCRTEKHQVWAVFISCMLAFFSSVGLTFLFLSFRRLSLRKQTIQRFFWEIYLGMTTTSTTPSHPFLVHITLVACSMGSHCIFFYFIVCVCVVNMV